MKLRDRLRDLILVVSSITLLSLAVFSIQNGVSLSMVTSRSMEPTIEAGNIAISKQIRKTEIRRGDVLILPLPQNRELKYMHRVFELVNDGKKTILTTKGDSNPNPDKWRIEILSAEVPKVISVVGSGFVFNSPVGRRSIFIGLIGGSVLLLGLALWRLLVQRER
jgi:signal peptidase